MLPAIAAAVRDTADLPPTGIVGDWIDELPAPEVLSPEGFAAIMALPGIRRGLAADRLSGRAAYWRHRVASLRPSCIPLVVELRARRAPRRRRVTRVRRCSSSSADDGSSSDRRLPVRGPPDEVTATAIIPFSNLTVQELRHVHYHRRRHRRPTAHRPRGV